MLEQLQKAWGGLPPKEQREIANWISRKMKPITTETAKGLLAELNEKAKTNYRPVASNLSLIQARLAEGYTRDEISRVIERKCLEWGNDPHMAQYIRPKTLFNATNFASYVGLLEKEPAQQQRQPLRFPPKEDLQAWQALGKKVGAHVNDTYGNIKAKAQAAYDRGDLDCAY